jgi:hypothetical protein
MHSALTRFPSRTASAVPVTAHWQWHWQPTRTAHAPELAVRASLAVRGPLRSAGGLRLQLQSQWQPECAVLVPACQGGRRPRIAAAARPGRGARDHPSSQGARPAGVIGALGWGYAEYPGSRSRSRYSHYPVHLESPTGRVPPGQLEAAGLSFVLGSLRLSKTASCYGTCARGLHLWAIFVCQWTWAHFHRCRVTPSPHTAAAEGRCAVPH